MTVSGYDSYLNVTSIENFLTNIKSTAVANGWTVDEDSIVSLGELYIHSTGLNGNQSLYYSFKIMTATDDTTKKFLVWHGNTGYNASNDWDNQPGQFTVLPDRTYYSNHYRWNEYSTSYRHDSLCAYWAVPTIEKQMVFANSQFIMFTQKIIQTDYAGNTFVGWCTAFVGAADSVNQSSETTLNLTFSANWQKNGYNGNILQPSMRLPTSNNQSIDYGYTMVPYGFKYDSINQFDLPPQTGINETYSGSPTKFIYTSIPLTSGRKTNTDNSVYDKHYEYNTNVAGSATFQMDKNTPNWAGSIMKNTTSNTITMVKPIIFNYDYSNGVEEYFYPTRASLPYYAIRMKPWRAPEDIITIGARDFMILPLFDVNDYFGIAIEI